MEENTKHKNYRFIEGEFSLAEAKEILLSLFLDKIKFHEQKDFSYLEQMGKNHVKSKQRIVELHKDIQSIQDFMDVSNAQDMVVKINAEINITLLSNP